ncbi:polymorphic toxin type 17 domain-containing protein [Erwinia wuhanensis]|uniref:polymorphic toxin type 17 domain-containing protein n=1 Tax=Erwinia wuhanensis TaxID=3045167 RepID=UPI0034643CA7
MPPEGYSPSQPLPRGPNNGYIDKFKNEWVKGPSRTAGQEFEWDVQLSRTGKAQLGWATRDGSHLNISLDGKVTHK